MLAFFFQFETVQHMADIDRKFGQQSTYHFIKCGRIFSANDETANRTMIHHQWQRRNRTTMVSLRQQTPAFCMNSVTNSRIPHCFATTAM